MHRLGNICRTAPVRSAVLLCGTQPKGAERAYDSVDAQSQGRPRNDRPGYQSDLLFLKKGITKKFFAEIWCANDEPMQGQ